MQKKSSSVVYTVLLVVIVLAISNTFVPDGPVKTVINLVTLAGAIYQAFKTYLPKNRLFRIIDFRLRKITFFRVLLQEKEVDTVLEGEVFNRFKAGILFYTISQLGNRTELISGPEIFNFEFPIDTLFSPGARPEDKIQDWKAHLNKQFTFITGASGSGKTFELMKRAGYMCRQLEPGFSTYELLEGKKIPLYVELKLLDGELNYEWIVDNVTKSAKASNQNINPEQLMALLTRHEVVYFFDGLDEVQQEYRGAAAEKILEMSQNTGMQITCRDNIFEDLENQKIFVAGNSPQAIFLKPLTEDWIVEILKALDHYSPEKKEEMISFIFSKPMLLQHLARPILLNLFVVVYHRLSEEAKKALGSSDEEETMFILWENYEDFITKKKLPAGTDIIGLRTITVWLAKIMGNDSFFIESIQPSWLRTIKDSSAVQDRWLQRMYFLSTRILASVLVGIALACIISTPFALVSNSIFGGLTISVLAGIYNMKSFRVNLPQWLTSSFFYLVMIVVLSVFCGVYQGFAVPRAPNEMTSSFFSVTECWPGILLGITLSVVFSYRIIMEKFQQKYILPIELFHFNWSHAFRYGLSWGLATAITTGSIALYVKYKFESGRFIKEWLVPNLRKILVHFNINPDNSGFPKNIDIAIFLYAFVVTFFVASLLIVLMAGRDPSAEQNESAEKKQKLNFGIKSSGKHAFLHASRVAVIAFLFYSVLIILFKVGDWVNGAMIAVGVFLLVFIWFGGMEVINHVILRLNLYVRGIAPLNYDPWVQSLQNMNLIVPSGYQMKFYHTSLVRYYSNFRIEGNERVRISNKSKKDRWVYAVALTICFALLTSPFVIRYFGDYYWTGEFDIKVRSEQLHKNSDSTYVVAKTGKYLAKSSGFVNVGTFVGWASAKGTASGFMGMPVDSVYNLAGLGGFRHAALLFRVKPRSSHWSEYRYVYDIDTLNLRAGDQLEFVVNDKEWQNNSGRFDIDVSLVK